MRCTPLLGIPLLSVFLLGAGIGDYVPHGPVLTAAERLRAFRVVEPSGARYTGPPRVSFPVAPLQVFGVTYDLDLVIRTRHPQWDMHEYALLRTPEGPVWLAKDARRPRCDGPVEERHGKTQSIVADVEGIQDWLPEVPLRRQRGTVEVDDRSTERRLDLRIRYTNVDGEPVEVHYAGRQPHGAARKRNTSTMGHSRESVLAVLDLPARAMARRATVTIGGERQRLVRVLGLVPVAAAILQTQGGFSVGRWQLGPEGTADGYRSIHLDGVLPVIRSWRSEAGEAEVVTTQTAPLRTLRHRYLRVDGALELATMEVEQFAQGERPVRVTFSPALPDVRRPFVGRARSRYVIDVGGQPSHGTGWVYAEWDGDHVVVEVEPSAPAWTRERALRSTVTWEGERARIRTRMKMPPCPG